jgi:putative membrane protein
MKVHENFARLMLIGGLSLSVAVAQTPNTSGTAGTPGQSSSPTGSTAGQNTGSGQGNTGGATGQTSGSRQGSAAGATGQNTGSSQGHVAGAAGSGDQSMVGANDRNFMTKAAQGGMMEVQLAQMAQQKASSDEVKQYAKRLEQDHTKANDQLKQIAQERQVSLPTDLGPHQQQMAKFQNLSGEEFDRAYIRMQVQHHKKDISEFRKQSNRGMDSDLKAFASAQLPTLEQHLQQAQQLSGSTGTRSRKASGASSTNTGSQGTGSQADHQGHETSKTSK